jgi:hypothetical protein
MKELTSSQWDMISQVAIQTINANAKEGPIVLNENLCTIVRLWVRYTYESNFLLEPKIVFLAAFSKMPPNDLINFFERAKSVSEFIIGIYNYYNWESLSKKQINQIELLCGLISDFASDKITGRNKYKIC